MNGSQISSGTRSILINKVAADVANEVLRRRESGRQEIQKTVGCERFVATVLAISIIVSESQS